MSVQNQNENHLISEPKLLGLSQRLGELLLQKKRIITTAESCTGGLIAAAITDSPGSSIWFEQSFVTYSNSAKQQLLGVPALVLDRSGAVSEDCVLAMAQGAADRSCASVAISVSGVAGPDGGTEEKPVGTVWIAWSIDSVATATKFLFKGDRHAVRLQTVEQALRGTIAKLQ